MKWLQRLKKVQGGLYVLATLRGSVFVFEFLFVFVCMCIWFCDFVYLYSCLHVFVFVLSLGRLEWAGTALSGNFTRISECILPFLFEFLITFCVCLCWYLYLCCYVFVFVLSLGRLEWAGTALSGNLTRISERILPFSFEFVIAFYVCLCLYLYLCCYVFVSVLSLGRLEWAGTTLSGNFTRISERILPFRLTRSIFHLSSPLGCTSPAGTEITLVFDEMWRQM